MTVFEAYITNLGKYAEGQLVGETLKFPATTEEVQSLLKNIGVDGVLYEEFFITAFDGDVMGLYDYLTEYENLDELNHLAHLISELDSDEIETLEAALNKGDHTSSVEDIINLVHNLDCYDLHPGVTDDETLGRINLLGMLALALFLIASDNPIQTVLFILAVWSIVLVLSLLAFYFSRKKYLNKLLNMTEQLEERYLLPEIMQVPERADEQVFYQIMKMAEKSMLERIGEVQRERREYKEYIEQWIHEVKTPITAMKLLCENNRSPFSREVLAELENINQYTEQALYYARSEHTEKDYSVREVNLCDVVHSAIADNKYLLRQSNISIQIDDIETKVYTDEKWVRFILNQIIGNAIKYHAEQPILHFGATKTNDKIVLSISDNGIGIPKSDLPRIFEKGFTGQNGRTGKNSTGIGLYLCKRLCDKLGIGLTAYSENRGTTISLIFQMNDFIIGVQG